jgi:hypothetical protein
VLSLTFDGKIEELSAAEMTLIALQGGAFHWLQDEPDLYSDADGEPV